MHSPPLSILLFLFLCFQAPAKPEPDAKITVASFITADKRNLQAAAWFSPSRLFAFGFYRSGEDFAVGIWFVPNFTVTWTDDRDGELLPEGSQLNLNQEGLQILSTNGDRSMTNISNTEKVASAIMQDCGNFVIFDVSNNIIWQTFDYPTDTLLAGQFLQTGKKLVSSISATNLSTGRFQMMMKDDGNYFLGPVNTPDTPANYYWSSNTTGDGYRSILLDEDGNLLPSEIPINTHYCNLSSLSTFLARIEPDGFLRVYSASTNKSTQLIRDLPHGVDKCSIKGACGPNSYCNFTAAGGGGGNISTGFFQGETACICFPGYDYTDRSKPYMGCQRNFSMGQCVTGNNISYSVTKLSNIYWSDDPYNYTDGMTEEDCIDSCLQDCNCYAALFLSQQICSKQRHPLLYGRSIESTAAFFKVGFGEMQPPPQPAPPGEVVDRVPKRKTMLLSMALASILFAPLAVAIFFFLFPNRHLSYQKLCRNMEIGLAGGLAPRSFTYKQLRAATYDFTKILGEGAFSTVFKGEIPLNNGEVMPIAVKRLDKKLSPVNEKGFRTEMRAVGRAHHRNVVRLLGFCHEGPRWLLIYEYMSRGSLSHLIFPAGEAQARPRWKERAGIAMDVARGILYLHEGCAPSIIHSDIKLDNVLVGEDGTAKISDLGLAKLLKPRKSDTYTRPRGTFLYKAPEWEKGASEPVSTKVDVYSFGVLLLELISCRKSFLVEAVDGCILLSQLAYKCLMESTLELLVPDGEEDVNKVEVRKMVMVALWCVQKAPRQRKSMKEVVRMLEGKMSVPMPPDCSF